MGNDFEKSILGAITTAALYVLALPIMLVKAIGRARKLARAIAILNAGEFVCPFCSAANPLNCMSRCATCAAVSPGSRLYCPFCKSVYAVITCAGCGATLKVV